MVSKIEPEVFWGEGMFLRPHHFQAAQRHLSSLVAHATTTVRPHSWGVRTLEIEVAAIKNFRFSVKNCDVLYPDGTLVNVPENAYVEAREFRKIFEVNPGTIEVFLGLSDTDTESSGKAAKEAAGWRTQSLDFRDENTGTNPQSVSVRRRHARILFSGEDHSGYRLFKLAEIVRDPDADMTPSLSPEFTPACSRLGADPKLQKVLRDIYHAVIAKNRKIGDQVRERRLKITGEVDAVLLLRLMATNTHLPVLRQMCEAPDLHPFEVYLELCRVLGSLAVFDPERVVPELPFWDQDRPLSSFRSVEAEVQKLMGSVAPTRHGEIPFEPTDQRLKMRCPLDPSWLSYDLFIGVRTKGEKADLDRAMLGLKFAGPSEIDHIVANRLLGVACREPDKAPPELPDREGLFFYKLDSRSDHWAAVTESAELVMVGPGTVDEQLGFSIFAVFPSGV